LALEVGSWRPFSTAVVEGRRAVGGVRVVFLSWPAVVAGGGGGDPEIRVCFFFWHFKLVLFMVSLVLR
jgi:hypothetical protein